ncbi:MAG: hypothetical protein K6E40_11385, partial [Desulfovibrio sp.]|nr:hypothetical protein [Desulfovibrio sp.]
MSRTASLVALAGAMLALSLGFQQAAKAAPSARPMPPAVKPGHAAPPPPPPPPGVKPGHAAPPPPPPG